jgi:hypothetical protein
MALVGTFFYPLVTLLICPIVYLAICKSGSKLYAIIEIKFTPPNDALYRGLYRGAIFGWKMSPQAAVLNREGSEGRNMEKYAILSTKFGHI